MKEIILATFNKNKKRELLNILGNDIKLKTLDEVNFTKKIIENGSSFIENSIIKCESVYKEINKPVIADDSGISADALKGAPGIYSARYGGKGLNDIQRYRYLLKKLKNSNNLNASFVCALVLYINKNKIYIIQEEVNGIITFNQRSSCRFLLHPDKK